VFVYVRYVSTTRLDRRSTKFRLYPRCRIPTKMLMLLPLTAGRELGTIGYPQRRMVRMNPLPGIAPSLSYQSWMSCFWWSRRLRQSSLYLDDYNLEGCYPLLSSWILQDCIVLRMCERLSLCAFGLEPLT